MRVQFQGIPRPVLFDGCADLLERIAGLTQGWRWQPADSADAPVISVTVTAPIGSKGGSWRIVSQWTPEPAVYDNVADIVCALLADLVLAHIEADQRLLCLHAGAVAIGPDAAAPLFVFPAESQTGKSTLTAALAISGGRLYSDDVLPLHLSGDLANSTATAIGLAPRPRLPLPDALPQPLRDAMLRRIALGNSRYGYVGLTREQLAPLGERRPIAAFVRLERAGGHAALTAEPRSEIMTLLLRQNFGAKPPAGEMVERFAALTATARCWRLRYNDIGQAIALLTAQAQNAGSAHQRLSA
jgi:hypothetical protein